MRRPLALLLLLVLACADEGAPEDPETRAGCDALCESQISCGDTDLAMTSCSNSCLADVGFPGEQCADALQVLATCTAAHCGDPAACATEEANRSTHCGGTG